MCRLRILMFFIPKATQVAESSAWIFGLGLTIEHQEFKTTTLMLNYQLVCASGRLPIPVERITIQPITVLRSV